MMTPLADGFFLLVKKTGQPVILHAVHERINDLPVREFYRLVLFGKFLDRDHLRNIIREMRYDCPICRLKR